jgi:DNA-binding XRE family transcriptional regulator
MRLSEYLDKRNMTPYRFAKEIGVSKQTVYNYIAHPFDYNFRMPSLRIMKKIIQYTGGEVRMKDFYEILEKEGEFEKLTGHTEVV